MQDNQFGYEMRPYEEMPLPLDQQQYALAQGNFNGQQPRTRLERVNTSILTIYCSLLWVRRLNHSKVLPARTIKKTTLPLTISSLTTYNSTSRTLIRATTKTQQSVSTKILLSSTDRSDWKKKRLSSR